MTATHPAAVRIRRADAAPFYAQLAEILRDRIRGGHHAPGDLLPSEADLGAFFGVSRTAVRQALDVLVADGLVLKQKGRGTIVTHDNVDQVVVHELRGFLDEMTRRGATVDTELVRLDREPVPPYAVAALELHPNDDVIVVERIRSVDGEPVVAVRTYLAADRFGALLATDLGQRGLYETLARDFDVHPVAGSRRFEAQLADDRLAAALGVEVGAPILTLTATNHDQHGAPFEFFVACYRGDRAAFDVDVGAGHDAEMDVRRTPPDHPETTTGRNGAAGATR